MRCREAEQEGNDRLDARGGRGPRLTPSSHAHRCPDCRDVESRLDRLGRALALPPETWSVPPGFADRVLDTLDGGAPVESVVRFRPSIRPAFRLAAAAAAALALASVTAGLWLYRGGPASESAIAHGGESAPAASANSREVVAALDWAKSATLAVALEASGPASWLGSGLIESAEVAEQTPTLRLPTAVPEADALLRGVGDRVSAGVRPFGGAARQAFGFLLGKPAPAGSG